MESDGVTVAYIGLLCPLISFVEVAAPGRLLTLSKDDKLSRLCSEMRPRKKEIVIITLACQPLPAFVFVAH